MGGSECDDGHAGFRGDCDPAGRLVHPEHDPWPLGWREVDQLLRFLRQRIGACVET